MKLIYLLLIVSTLLCSCSTYTATLKKQDDLGNEAIRAYPAWEYKDPGVKKAVVPAIAATAGAAYGYRNETTISDETFTDAENAAIWALGGLAAGSIINAVLFPRRNRSKEQFRSEQSDRWLRSFNKATGKDYVLSRKDMDNTLVLLPKKTMQTIRAQFRTLEMDLKRDAPMTSFGELRVWKRKLEGEYAIMPMEEVAQMSQLIDEHTVKVARRDLLIKMEDIKRLGVDYETLPLLQDVKNSHYSLFMSADRQTQQKFDDLIEQKTSNILKELMEAEKQKLDKIENSVNGLRKINAFVQQFDQKYRTWFGHPIVDDTDAVILQKINSITTAQNKELQSKIKSFNDITNLRRFETTHFAYLKDYESANIRALTKDIFEQKQAIEEAERRRLAQEARERKQAEIQKLAHYGFKFNTDGIYNKRLIDNIFKGNFAAINYNRGDIFFISLVEKYMYARAKSCARYRSASSTQIYEQVCARESVTTRGFIEVSRYCIEWVDQPTGLYTSPELYAAHNTLKRIAAGDQLKNTINMMGDWLKGGTGAITNTARVYNTLHADIEKLLVQNNCSNKALQRFEENLIRFAENKAPLNLDGQETVSTVDYSRSQNFDRLVEDLVYANSSSWAFTYIRNSVKNVTITARDAYNRPKTITALYTFDGFSGYQQDKVEITFKNGIPDCIYFSNYSANCRTPDRKIISKLVNGDYIKY